MCRYFSLFTLFAPVSLAPALAAVVADQPFPNSPWIIDVTRPPYSAKGNGVTDDTEAPQRAIQENVGHHRILFSPGNLSDQPDPHLAEALE